MNRKLLYVTPVITTLFFMHLRHVQAGVAVEDTFNYADQLALIDAGWQDAGPGSPQVANSYFFTGSGSNFISELPAEQPPFQTEQTTTRLGNAAISYDLGVTLTQDWIITANVAIAGYSRAMQIGLGDAATGAGYSLHWNASSPTTHGGHGFALLVAQNGWTTLNPIESNGGGINLMAAPVSTKAFPTGYALPDPVLDANSKVRYTDQDVFLGYTEIKLSWSAQTGILEARQNNDQIPDEETLLASVDLNSFPPELPRYTSFSRLYISGGTNSFVDYVKVESNEIDETDPGDFDEDGDVDGRDFLLWQRGESPSPLSSADLLEWQENFGAGPLVATSVVPEPSAAVLVASIASLLGLVRRRSKS